MRLRLDQMACCNWKAHLVHVCGQPVQPWTVLWRKGKIQILHFNRHGRFEALPVSSDRKHGVVIGMLSFAIEDGTVPVTNSERSGTERSNGACKALNWEKAAVASVGGPHFQGCTLGKTITIKTPQDQAATVSPTVQPFPNLSDSQCMDVPTGFCSRRMELKLLHFLCFELSTLPFWQGQARIWPARYVWTSRMSSKWCCSSNRWCHHRGASGFPSVATQGSN